MDLSFNEVAVLAASGSDPQSKEKLAIKAATLFQSTKFDAMTALQDINNLESRRFLVKLRDGRVELTREGYAAVLNALPIIENLRAAVAGVSYRVVR